MRPRLSAEVDAVIARYPAAVQARLAELRTLIHDVAHATKGVGVLTETLKWGEPAFLTDESGSGSLIRIDRFKQDDASVALYFHCQTDLVETFRASFGSDLTYEKNRAIVLDVSKPLPVAALKICIAQALTYKLRKHG